MRGIPESRPHGEDIGPSQAANATDPSILARPAEESVASVEWHIDDAPLA